MIEKGWNDEPVHAKVNWLKIPEGKSVYIQFLNSNLINYTAHYMNKRMRLCQGVDCVFCRGGIGTQRRYVFDVVDVVSGNQYAFEASDSLSQKIREHTRDNRELSNRVFELSRMSASKFSNMQIIEIHDMHPLEENDFPIIDLAYLIEYQETLFSLERKGDLYMPQVLRDYREKLASG